MKDAGIDPVISDLIFARKKARIKPGFFVGVCTVRHTRFKVFLLVCITTLVGNGSLRIRPLVNVD